MNPRYDYFTMLKNAKWESEKWKFPQSERMKGTEKALDLLMNGRSIGQETIRGLVLVKVLQKNPLRLSKLLFIDLLIY